MEKLTERFRLIPNIAFNNDGFIFDQIVVGKDFLGRNKIHYECCVLYENDTIIKKKRFTTTGVKFINENKEKLFSLTDHHIIEEIKIKCEDIPSLHPIYKFNYNILPFDGFDLSKESIINLFKQNITNEK